MSKKSYWTTEKQKLEEKWENVSEWGGREKIKLNEFMNSWLNTRKQEAMI